MLTYQSYPIRVESSTQATAPTPRVSDDTWQFYLRIGRDILVLSIAVQRPYYGAALRSLWGALIAPVPMSERCWRRFYRRVVALLARCKKDKPAGLLQAFYAESIGRLAQFVDENADLRA